MNDFKCSGCGKEPHPNIPCSEARALRRPAKKKYAGYVYVVWTWAERNAPKRVLWAGTEPGRADGEARAARVMGYLTKVKKTKVVF